MDFLNDLIENTNYLPYIQPFNDSLAQYPWIQAFAVLFLTFGVASIITWIVFAILKRLTKKTKTYMDDHLVSLAKAPVYYSLVITGFSTAVKIAPLSEETTRLLIYGFKTLGVLIWTIALIRFSKLILKQLAWLSTRGKFLQPQTLPLFSSLSQVVIIITSIYIGFQIWGIDMTAWLASAGIIGIAVGFAAKDTLANLFSGVFILADAPYKIGDYVVLDNTDRGKVTHIGIRSTRFLTRDDVEITVPNSIVGNSKIINQSGGPHVKFRVRIAVGVAYGTDIDQVRAILMETAVNNELVCESPTPRIRFRTFGASSLDFELLCWIEEPELRGRAMDSLNDTIYKRFMAEEIEIPYDKRDIYIKEMPETKT